MRKIEKPSKSGANLEPLIKTFGNVPQNCSHHDEGHDAFEETRTVVVPQSNRGRDSPSCTCLLSVAVEALGSAHAAADDGQRQQQGQANMTCQRHDDDFFVQLKGTILVLNCMELGGQKKKPLVQARSPAGNNLSN